MGRSSRRARIVVGLAYGDEGKGSWVDHLVRMHNVPYVVRFNGGPQAAHNVVTSKGKHHCFSQFGSGTFVPGCKTILPRFMLIDPQYALQEAERLLGCGVPDPCGLLLVSEDSPVVTPSNRLLNRIQETARGNARHGSCGYGIGVTQNDVDSLGDQTLYVRDLSRPELFDKLLWLAERRAGEAQRFACAETADLIDKLTHVDLDYYVGLYREFIKRVRVVSAERIGEIIRENDTVFEGAQGVLLDQQYGFFPYCTRSACTYGNAERLLGEAGFEGEITRIGLLRGYATRHGAGPLVTEDEEVAVAPCHNSTNPWQGRFRVGWFDAVTARYALGVVGGVDVLAVTNLDRMNGLQRLKQAWSYQHDAPAFFSASGEKMHETKTGLDVSAERTRAMLNIVPRYEELQGWNGSIDGRFERYVQKIETLLGRRVDAVSFSADHAKIYR